MANKRRKKNNSRAGSALTACVIIAIVLIFAFGSGGNLPSNLKEIWGRTADNAGGVETDAQAGRLSDLSAHGGELIFYVIDTGNSDSMLLRAPDGSAMLVDAADSDDLNNISATIRALEIETLDCAVATHPDADHIGSMAGVVSSFRPAVLRLPDYPKETAAYQRMMTAAEENGVTIDLARAPEEFALGDAHITVFSPREDAPPQSANDASVVMLVSYGGIKILLTGDAETEALSAMIGQYGPLLDADVLKVGHHGSHTSTSQELLDAVTPEIAVITCGEGNDYGHPHRETTQLLEQNGIKTLRTDRNGDIAIFTDGTEVQYATAA